MFLFKRLLLYFNLIFWIGGLEYVRLNKTWAWWFLGLAVVLLFLTIFDFTKKTFNRRFFNFLITPLIFSISVFGSLLFVFVDLYYHLIVLGSGIFIYLFLEQILNYFYFAVRYQPYTLEYFSFYWNMLAVMAFSSCLFGFYILYQFNVYLLAGIYLALIFLVTKEIFWVNKIEWNKYALFCVAIPLIMFELFVVFSYLPSSYYVNAIILTVIYYVLIGLSKLFLQEKLNSKNLLSHLIVGGVSMLVVLFTAQWI